MRRRAGLSWFGSAVARWTLAGALLVALTIRPTDDPQSASSIAPSYRLAVVPDPILVARAERPARKALVSPADARDVDTTAAIPSGERSLRAQLKPDAGEFPEIVRGAKGEPAHPMPASLSRRGLALAAASTRIATRLAFVHDAAALPPAVLTPGPVDPPDWTEARRLAPWSGSDPTLTRNASSLQSPAAAAAGSTGAARSSGRLGGDGATPRSARALVLSSATPAPIDAAPVKVAAAPVSMRLSPALPVSLALQGAPIVQVAPALPVALPLRVEPDLRPRYAELLDPDKLDREQRCLAEAVYFEARSEPEQGQAAVAQVVLNRVRSGLYPESVCGVVYQNRHHHLACQFTFACEGKLPRVTEPDAWEVAQRIALDVTDGRTYLADVGGATHYHADYVRPSWARRLKRMDAIGRHVFYQLRPGQT